MSNIASGGDSVSTVIDLHVSMKFLDQAHIRLIG